MIAVRSVAFTAGLWLVTLAAGLAGLPLLAAPRRTAFALAVVWARTVLWLLRVAVGLRHRVVGCVQPDPDARYIYAVKHQSAWETIAFPVIAPAFAAVLKEELKHLPFYGWYLSRAGMVPIRRSARGAALKRMLRSARAMVDIGRHLLIMPEGTRMPPGRTGRYHPGVYALYKYLGLPVVPVAHNAGLFWPRNGFLKRPGVIAIEFLEPIPPGLDREPFMATLEERIETAARRLYEAELAGRDAGRRDNGRRDNGRRDGTARPADDRA